MSNIKSKIMVFFVIFSLIFNFNSKGYSSVFETQKEKTKIEIYSLDIKNTQTEFYQLFNNNQFKSDIFFNENESKIIINQLISGYLNAYPSGIVGIFFGFLVPLIAFLIKNFFKDQKGFYPDDKLIQSILFSLSVFLGMTYGISSAIYNKGIENNQEKWKGNFELTFLSTFSSTLLFLVSFFGIAFFESKTKESSSDFSGGPIYSLLFLVFFPLYMTVAGVIGYHLTKKEVKNKNDEILYNKKDDFAKIEEFNKEFLAFSQKININNDKVTFNVFSF